MIQLVLRGWIRARLWFSGVYHEAEVIETKRKFVLELTRKGMEPPSPDMLDQIVTALIAGMPAPAVAMASLQRGYKPYGEKTPQEGYMVFDYDKSKVVH